ncbi:hypothetical protein ACFXKR_39670 [Streptomyces violascens]|uniref:NHL domain-containing protein n=1 Tax=Streptomyces violascens TaxID=67381 RepID=UPI0036BAD97F
MTESAQAKSGTADVLPRGYIATVAGGGTKELDAHSQGQSATEYKLGGVLGVALDGRGNIYIHDDYLGLLRVMGGKLYMNHGDIDGYRRSLAWIGSSLYVSVGQRVQTMTPPSPTLTAIAGSGKDGYDGDGKKATEASLNFPCGVATDREGNLYIADRNNHRIRKVDTAGIISTFAGNGIKGEKIEEGEPATKARVGLPWGICVGGAGTVYFGGVEDGQYAGGRVYKVTDGKIYTVAGGGAKTVPADGSPIPARDANLGDRIADLAMSPSGNIYLAATDINQVCRLDVTKNEISLVAGNGRHEASGDSGPAIKAGIANPYGLALDSSGNLYISEAEGAAAVRVVAGVEEPVPVPVIVSPMEGDVVTDLRQPVMGSTVPEVGKITIAEGATVLGTAVPASNAWRYIPPSDWAQGPHTITAIAYQGTHASPPATRRFTAKPKPGALTVTRAGSRAKEWPIVAEKTTHVTFFWDVDWTGQKTLDGVKVTARVPEDADKGSVQVDPPTDKPVDGLYTWHLTEKDTAPKHFTLSADVTPKKGAQLSVVHVEATATGQSAKGDAVAEVISPASPLGS